MHTSGEAKAQFARAPPVDYLCNGEPHCFFNLTALRFRWDLVVFPGGGKVGAARHNPGASGG